MSKKEEPKFTPHDGVPDHEAWLEWEEQLLTHVGKSDELGSSMADCILDVHRGSVGNPHVGTPQQVARSQALERALKKETFSYMLLHMAAPISARPSSRSSSIAAGRPTCAARSSISKARSRSRRPQ